MANQITAQDRELILNIAKLYVETPYQFGWNWELPGEPMDCSKFIQVIFANVWINLERTSALQWAQFVANNSFSENLADAQVWDLIFFKNTYESENEITHVWIYAWNNQTIDAKNPKIMIYNIDRYWKTHFKWVWLLDWFTKSYNKSLATKNYNRIKKIEDDKKYAETLKAVNAVIAVLTSTWWDMPEKYQAMSADYAKQLRTQYPEARKLEPEQAKKVYQSIVDMLSYARKFAWADEQQKYSELNQYLRKKFNLK